MRSIYSVAKELRQLVLRMLVVEVKRITAFSSKCSTQLRVRMDLEKDKEFLHIAEEGLKAPVPEPW